MNKLIIPKQQKLNEAEEIAMPMVRCSFCEKMTSTGMKQSRLELIEKGDTKIVNGKTLHKPPRMKRVDLFMCTHCIKNGTKWPGSRP